MKELIFTSAPRGLKPGSRGFTTVAASAQLSPPLMARLEKLSAYPFAFELGDPKAPLNPVGYSYLRVRLTGGTVGVLSRRCAAGVDYSGRSNTLAHHMVIETGERPAAGPAWLASQPGIFTESWSQDEPPHTLPPRTPPAVDDPPKPCDAWDRATGDAGWGGALVRHAHQSSTRPAYLIYAAGQDVLPLIRESLALLPEDRRWRTCFNTYFTGDAADVSCHWRGVLDGTPAARAARKAEGALVIDLTSPLPAPAGDAYTDAARAGMVYEVPAGRPTTDPTPQPTAPSPIVDVIGEGGDLDHDPYDLQDDPTGPRPPGAPPPIHIQPRRPRWLVPVVVVAAAVVCLVAAGGTAGVWYMLPVGPPPPPKNRTTQSSKKTVAGATDSEGTGTSPKPKKDKKSNQGHQPGGGSSDSGTAANNHNDDSSPTTSQGEKGKLERSEGHHSDTEKGQTKTNSAPESIKIAITKAGAIDSSKVGDDYKPIPVDKHAPINLPSDHLLLKRPHTSNQLDVEIKNKQIIISTRTKNISNQVILLATLSFLKSGDKPIKIQWKPTSNFGANRDKFKGLRLIVADKADPKSPMIFYVPGFVEPKKISFRGQADALSQAKRFSLSLACDAVFLPGETKPVTAEKSKGRITVMNPKDGKLVIDPSKKTVEIQDPFLKDWKDFDRKQFTDDIETWRKDEKSHQDDKTPNSTLTGEKAKDARKDWRAEDDKLLKKASDLASRYNTLAKQYEAFKGRYSEATELEQRDQYGVVIKRLAIEVEPADLPPLPSVISAAAKQFKKDREKKSIRKNNNKRKSDG